MKYPMEDMSNRWVKYIHILPYLRALLSLWTISLLNHSWIFSIAVIRPSANENLIQPVSLNRLTSFNIPEHDMRPFRGLSKWGGQGGGVSSFFRRAVRFWVTLLERGRVGRGSASAPLCKKIWWTQLEEADGFCFKEQHTKISVFLQRYFFFLDGEHHF